MANPLMQNRSQANEQMSSQQYNQMYAEFQKSPTDFLVKCGLDVPKDFNGNYRALVEQYANAGLVPKFLQGRVNAMLGRR